MYVIRIGQFWRHWRIGILMLEAAALVFYHFSTLSGNMGVGNVVLVSKLKKQTLFLFSD